MSNPLLPSLIDGVVMVAAMIGLMLAFIALVSVLRSAPRSGWHVLGWVLIVLTVPFIGAAMWFVAGRQRPTARPVQDADVAGRPSDGRRQ